eukprot:scaffold15395_cov147-Isochrysis_galbana.AAC.3
MPPTVSGPIFRKCATMDPVNIRSTGRHMMIWLQLTHSRPNANAVVAGGLVTLRTSRLNLRRGLPAMTLPLSPWWKP